MPTQRTMVHIQAWIAQYQNLTTLVDNWWIDVTDTGSAGVAAAIAAANAASAPNVKAAVTQYHVYFADGGHARYNERDFKIQETKLGPAQPDLAPVPLVPTPEPLGSDTLP